MNLYDILGLPREAPMELIKTAYKNKAKEHHPDKGGDENDFKDLKFAYDTLRDPQCKAEYDKTGRILLTKDQIHQRTIGELIKIFWSVVNQRLERDDALTYDYVDLMLFAVKDAIKGYNKHNKRGEKKIQQLIAIHERLIFKGQDTSNNIISQSINAEIESMKKIIETNVNNIKILEFVLEILELYDFNTIMTIANNKELPNAE